jgi:4-aminobutyrate aminotransferase-like enzyme/Ser/Thr protein kinase RdoA (MazF antagonist)
MSNATVPAVPNDPLEAAPPSFSLEEAAALARRLFGIDGVAGPLDSERDQNFRIQSDDGSFVLKISNVADSREVIEMQSEAMLHIARCDPRLPVMQPVTTMDGALHATVEDDVQRAHFVRLVTAVPGTMVASTNLSLHSVRDFGAMVARMGLALRGFFHRAGDYKILWDLEQTPQLRELVAAVEDPARRDIVERVLDGFDERVAPSLPRLRAQLIHNDLTLDNVLLDERHAVSGIVDFGDLTHTALVCDLAIALVSLMWGRADPLQVCDAAIGGYAPVATLEEAEAELLSDLMLARLAALVVIAAWRVRRYPDNAEYIMGNVALAWALLERLDGLGFAELRGHVGGLCLRRGSLPMSPAPIRELLERRQRVLGPALAPLSYERPLYVVRAEGARMFDHEGRAYLDAYNNVPVVGHCHPRVVAAIAQQSATLNTNTRYLHEAVVELAERLADSMPEGLDTVMLFNSGSEANDVAWRLATAYTGGAGGIVTARAYHGVTTATTALSPEEWGNGEIPPHIETVPPPRGYEDLHGGDEADWAARHIGHVEAALARLRARDVPPAALFVDALFTSDGIFTPPPIYLQDVLGIVHEAGCLLVADEVQGGFGRTAAHLWCFQAAGITPDLVTLGKPMGNGHPVAAVVTRSEIAQRFATTTDLFSTFGGNPVACRAALAVLDAIAAEGLQERAAATGAHLRSRLVRLRGAQECVADVRGAGLMIGVELGRHGEQRDPAPELAHAVMNRMRERGVLVGATGAANNVLKIRPPLVLSLEEADVVANALEASLVDVGGVEPR